jgi:hypothetical protein
MEGSIPAPEGAATRNGERQMNLLDSERRGKSLRGH